MQVFSNFYFSHGGGLVVITEFVLLHPFTWCWRCHHVNFFVRGAGAGGSEDSMSVFILTWR